MKTGRFGLVLVGGVSLKVEILRYLVPIDEEPVLGGEGASWHIPDGWTLWEVSRFNATRFEVICVRTDGSV